MRELAARGISVALTCRVLNIARQVYYRWLPGPVTDADLALGQTHRANVLFGAHRDDSEFGYRYLHEEAAEAGQLLAERTAWRICSDNRWWSALAERRSKSGKRPGPPVHDDLVQRNFIAAGPNELWRTDITSTGRARASSTSAPHERGGHRSRGTPRGRSQAEYTGSTRPGQVLRHPPYRSANRAP